MSTRSLLLALALAACAPLPASRGPGAAIHSIVGFQPSRLDGTWREVAAQGCAGGGVTFAGHGSRASGPDCGLGLSVAAVPVRPTGPGRLRLGQGPELWVLWVDADYRTLVLGSPDGRIAAILNRGGDLPEDRRIAALRVLEFNGFETARLTGPVT